MFQRPLEQTLRGFSFEGSAFDKTSFYVTAFFMALCIPRKHLIFNLGERLREQGRDRWTIKEKNVQAALESAMKKQVVFFNRLRTPLDVADAASQSGNPKDPYSQETVAYMLALAKQRDAAIGALDRLLQMLDRDLKWQHEMATRAQLLKSELIEDPKNATNQLGIWRTESLRNLSLLDFATEPQQAC